MSLGQPDGRSEKLGTTYRKKPLLQTSVILYAVMSPICIMICISGGPVFAVAVFEAVPTAFLIWYHLSFLTLTPDTIVWKDGLFRVKKQSYRDVKKVKEKTWNNASPDGPRSAVTFIFRDGCRLRISDYSADDARKIVRTIQSRSGKI